MYAAKPLVIDCEIRHNIKTLVYRLTVAPLLKTLMFFYLKSVFNAECL